MRFLPSVPRAGSAPEKKIWPWLLAGTHILRVETAGLAGAAAILALCEERAVDELD
jgi:hypothetical protein